MSLHKRYGSPFLDYNEFPDLHDPHRCGSAPFVPAIDAEGNQHSCGSYPKYFDKNGCNRYMPNYPDDEYLKQHGGADYQVCKCGVKQKMQLPDPVIPLKHCAREPDQCPHFSDGKCTCTSDDKIKVHGIVEPFLGNAGGGCDWTNTILFVVLTFMALRYLKIF